VPGTPREPPRPERRGPRVPTRLSRPGRGRRTGQRRGHRRVDRRQRTRTREVRPGGVHRGSDVDPTLGADAADLLEDAGCLDVTTRRYDHVRTLEPPYDDADLQAVAKKANGAGLASDEASLRATLSADEYDDLRENWREMGREAAAQTADGDYRRTETVLFYVTVGRVPDDR